MKCLGFCKSYHNLSQTQKAHIYYKKAHDKSSNEFDKFKTSLFSAIINNKIIVETREKNPESSKIFELNLENKNLDDEIWNIWTRLSNDEQQKLLKKYQVDLEQCLYSNNTLKSPLKIIAEGWTSALSTNIEAANTQNNQAFKPNSSSIKLLSKLARRLKELALKKSMIKHYNY